MGWCWRGWLECVGCVWTVWGMADGKQVVGGGGPPRAPRRYLGDIARLSWILARARVQHPGNVAAAIRSAARELGFELPAGGGRELAGHLLDPGSGWRPVEDRPGAGPRVQALAAFRMAALGCLVVAIRAGWETEAAPVAVVPVHGLVGLRERERTLGRLLERLDGFGEELGLSGGGGGGRGGRWQFRQPPAWVAG